MFIGTGIPASTQADPLGQALAAEAYGYDFVSVSDHPAGGHPSYEALTLLTWIAARTERIGIATRVLGVPFRRPALIAKSAESLQRLSAGRLILGLGGGYSDEEIVAVGGPALTAREKVDGLADAIEIMRAAWTGERVTYAGAAHSVSGLQLAPPPMRPIPIWLGTYGPRALAVTGRLADGWIPSLGFVRPPQIPEMLDRIRAAAVAADRAPDAVRAILNVSIRLAPLTADDAVSGTPGEVAEQLCELAALGFAGVNLLPEASQFHTVGEQVLPALRELAQPDRP